MPAKAKMLADRSRNEWAASARIATLPVSRPTSSFAAIRTILTRTEERAAPAVLPSTSGVDSRRALRLAAAENPAGETPVPVQHDETSARLGRARHFIGDRRRDRTRSPPRRSQRVAADAVCEDALARVLRSLDDERRTAEIGEARAEREEHGGHCG